MAGTYIDAVIDRLNVKLLDLRPDVPAELTRLFALLTLALGQSVQEEDVHDAWSIWCSTVQGDHPALIPFGDLSAEKQVLDAPYVQAIRAVARELDLDPPPAGGPVAAAPRLTDQTIAVLRVLLEDPDRARYGREIGEATGLKSGTLHPIFDRLKRAGWVDSTWEESGAHEEEARPRRRYHRLTPYGLASARDAVAGFDGVPGRAG